MPSNDTPWYSETLTRHVEDFEKQTEIEVSANARILIRTSLDALIEDPNSRWMREARHEAIISYYLEHLSELLLAATFHKAVKLRRAKLIDLCITD